MSDDDLTMGELAAPDRYAIGDPMGEVYPPQGGDAVRVIGRGIKDYVKTPGSLMAKNPYPEGSELWQWYESNKADTEAGFGASTALNTMGTGAIAGVPARAGEVVLGAGAVRGRAAPVGEVAAPDAYVAPGIGHNNPPPEFAIGDVAAPAEPAAKSWTAGLPRPQPAARSTEIPEIRGLPVDDAIELARKQHHLIQAGDQSQGYYVGGPRDVQSKNTLNAIRRQFDDYVAADPRGGDWYDRYRAGLNDVTGGDPVSNQWAANQHGQWSAGVDPGSELHFVLKENNASIAGMPVKAARPAQHEAHMAAIAEQDPGLYQLGDKTAEYASKVNPDQVGPPGATGVNDFRHARNFRYTEPSGEAQRDALGNAGHRFLDYETALAVDRANRSNLGGRNDWTGEQLQAAPWVRQKALDIQGRGGKNEDGSFKISYEDAVLRANRTITDYFDRHTYFATHEAQPGADVVGHMPGSVAAPQDVRDAYALDPRSDWATAPGARDAIYSGLGIEGTGVNMRVRPSLPMRGMYTRPDGTTEFNMGQVARPLGTFDKPRVYDKEFVGPRPDDPFKATTPADRSLLNAGEAVRGYVDAQNASAWHKVWFGGPNKESTSLYFPRPGPASPQDMLALRGVSGKYGMGDIVDTGQGITSTQFYGGPPPGGKAFDQAVRGGEFAPFGEPRRARVDSDYIDRVPQWQAGLGSGEATRQMLGYVNQTPEIRSALNRNPYLADRALARMARDDEWAAQWGAPRKDIQNARAIIGVGPGWVDRIEAALKAGVLLPATAAAIFAAAQASQREGQNGAL